MVSVKLAEIDTSCSLGANQKVFTDMKIETIKAGLKLKLKKIPVF